ncbi:hypothetical protein [Effusibacillus consociatus]|uniref:Uncharacterized protein n=1 Tax=Effusibacillus consociatus TaxID=1117041 RepID=A0ABV9PZB7_9BACL
MVKNRWLKLSLFSLAGILVFGLLQAIFQNLFSSAMPQGTQTGMGSGMGMMGSGMGMMGSGMGMGQGMMAGTMGSGAGMSSGTLLGSFASSILTVLTVLAVIALFVGLIGFAYKYVKKFPQKASNQ